MPHGVRTGLNFPLAFCKEKNLQMQKKLIKKKYYDIRVKLKWN